LSRAIIEGTPTPTPLEDGVANMRVIDAVYQSGRAGKWVDLK
jgi:predicted dehydrogenase